MALAARLARDAIVTRIDEADEFGRFLVEQSIAAFGVRRAVVPRAGQGRLRVRDLHRGDVVGIFVAELGLAESGGRSRIAAVRSGEHTSELQSLMRISSAVFCLKIKHLTSTSHNLM